MIVIPAIPAIVAALTPIVNGALAAAAAAAPVANAAIVAAGVGAAIGGATCAIGGAVSGFQEHGELNREVAIEAVHNVPKCAAEGAFFGAVTVPAGLLVAPVVAPLASAVSPAIAPVFQIVDDAAGSTLQFIDDAAKPVLGAVDDVTKSAGGSIDDAAAIAGSPMIVDDAVSQTANKAGKSAGSVGYAIISNFNRKLNSFRARIYKRLPVTTVGADDGWVYVIEDSATGIKKIGHTSNPKQRLKSLQGKLGQKNVRYSCIIHSSDNKGLERHLKNQFTSQKTTHSIPHDGMTEWFVLSAVQVAAACSH
ncbi:MAG: GIY-YIG nuclease family protein [Chloroflexota bacterium]|nr:GIY-YIG nuclease family protein [Chloroflexota bacterium]